MTSRDSLESKPISMTSNNDLEANEQVYTQDETEEIHQDRDSLDITAQYTDKTPNSSNILQKVASHISTRSWIDPGPPPDGGRKAWTQVGCAWLVLFTTWGYVNSFGAFQAYYTETLGVAPSTISWIGSIQVWLTFFIGAFSGRLLDAGFFVPTFVVGAVLQLLGIFFMSLSKQYWQLMLTQGVLTGIGNGIFFCPSLGLTATYFSDRRAFALGVATTGNSAGGIVYPLIVRSLLPKLGFAWTTRVLGFVNLACLLVVLFLMRPRLPPRTSGPIIDWSAFKEPTYVLFVTGLFFVIWAVYYTFYYVSLTLAISRMGGRYMRREATDNIPDCILRHGSYWSLLLRLCHPRRHTQRHWDTYPSHPTLLRRQDRILEPYGASTVHYNHHSLLLARRVFHCRFLRLHLLLWSR